MYWLTPGIALLSREAGVGGVGLGSLVFRTICIYIYSVSYNAG